MGAAAIVGLVVVASLSVIVVNSFPFADPLQRVFLRPADAPLPPSGTLSIQMFSNQDFSTIVAMPLNDSIPLTKWPVAVYSINATIVSEAPLSTQTDQNGSAVVSLQPGTYFVQAPYGPLQIQVPVQIFSGNTTAVQIHVSESAYSLLYSEAVDVAAQPSVYVELGSSSSVAKTGDTVSFQVEGGPGGSSEVQAVVVSQWPPEQGTQWLKLEPLGFFSISSAKAVILATWTYTDSVMVTSTGASAPGPQL